MGMHDGHRKRKKDQFRQSGLDSFADHEILELLLFYAIPRQDTNPTAHLLLDRFRTLDGVFNASLSELQEVEGVGESAATLIKSLFPICERAIKNTHNENICLESWKDSGEFFKDIFCNETSEVICEACLDVRCNVIRCFRISDGTHGSTGFDVRKIVENALAVSASAIVIARNRPDGEAFPNETDYAATKAIQEAAGVLDINFHDYVIVSGDRFCSLKNNGYIDGMAMRLPRRR